MATLIALVLLLILLSCGVQIAVALGLISALLIAFHPAIPAAVLADVAIGAIDKYVLLAIPLFIFAGTVVTKGDVAARIVALVETLVRPVRGAMALTAIIGGVFFAAVNGSSVAGAVALGPSLMTTLPAQGYPKRFVAALTAVASTVGLMIPPSLSFILIGSLMELSIVDLFVAGIIPGLVESLLLGVATLWMAHRHQYGLPPQPIDVREFGRRLPPALAALAMPVVIIGTIYAGLFTPTEVAAVAALYAAILVGLIYRNVGLRDICGCARETVLQTAMIFMLLVSASLLTFVLTRLGLARDILEITHRIDPSPLAFLLFVNVLLLVLGTVFDGLSMILISAPILFPIAKAVGVDPIHFAVIMTANIEIATLTPPVGLNIFVMSRIARLRVEETSRAIVPFYGIRLAGLALITLIPELSLYLVRLTK